MNNLNIVIVIPCYKVKSYIENVILTLPSCVNRIIVVDDKCPQQSGKFVESLNISNVDVLYHKVNQGVGGAMISGYNEALKLNSDIVVKIDGDGQMNPDYIESLIKPIVDNKADYTKGNRFRHLSALKTMPKIRLFGNSGLSFLVKVSSGYWNIMDPTNGFTAISKDALCSLSLDNIARGYFFESDMLINLNIEDIAVKDISIPAIYNDEESSLSVSKVLISFPYKLFKGFWKRILYKYFIYDFNMVSIYLILGLPIFIFGFAFGAISWYQAIISNSSASIGTVMLAALSIILGVQFLLQAISIDIDNIPTKEQ